eukprot:NODE_4811_length_1843_cov_14.026807.p1 GENE.NODE_4811_length_1843_cov_14.026807~~NODE_4811_length_1843_cov_14.026807.p1  ORF type:complete len:457 (+),score=69.42 NODE_4811_length_1843_cov_14.026807:232-1602(+)
MALGAMSLRTVFTEACTFSTPHMVKFVSARFFVVLMVLRFGLVLYIVAQAIVTWSTIEFEEVQATLLAFVDPMWSPNPAEAERDPMCQSGAMDFIPTHASETFNTTWNNSFCLTYSAQGLDADTGDSIDILVGWVSCVYPFYYMVNYDVENVPIMISHSATTFSNGVTASAISCDIVNGNNEVISRSVNDESSSVSAWKITVGELLAVNGLTLDTAHPSNVEGSRGVLTYRHTGVTINVRLTYYNYASWTMPWQRPSEPRCQAHVSIWPYAWGVSGYTNEIVYFSARIRLTTCGEFGVFSMSKVVSLFIEAVVLTQVASVLMRVVAHAAFGTQFQAVTCDSYCLQRNAAIVVDPPVAAPLPPSPSPSPLPGLKLIRQTSARYTIVPWRSSSMANRGGNSTAATPMCTCTDRITLLEQECDALKVRAAAFEDDRRTMAEQIASLQEQMAFVTRPLAL